LAITLTAVVAAQLVAPALALAYGASYTVGGLVSIGVLSGRLGGLGRRGLLRFTVRVSVAAVPAAVVAWLCVVGLEAGGLDVGRKLDSLVLVAVGGTLGLVTYLALARLLRLTEIARIVGVVISRGKRG
jgi:putative peptidoglycan lipid II flippase